MPPPSSDAEVALRELVHFLEECAAGARTRAESEGSNWEEGVAEAYQTASACVATATSVRSALAELTLLQRFAQGQHRGRRSMYTHGKVQAFYRILVEFRKRIPGARSLRVGGGS